MCIRDRDYTAVQGTVFVTGASPQATFAVPILADQLDEPDETFNVVLDGPFAGPVTLAVTIRNRSAVIFQNGFEDP